MWNEEDKMMGLVDAMNNGNASVPAECPVCHERSAHYLMHRAQPGSNRGSAWIWCDVCGSYTHFSYLVPDWWKNPAFVEASMLDSTVEYPHSMEREIDSWVDALSAGKL
ncbi:MAG: hypothetical protein ACOX69_06160 [Coriobacteriales bacterium]|jgi:hypothetical protein